MRKLLALLLCYLPVCCAPAFAQQTKAGMTTEINTNYPNNTSGAITPQVLRQTSTDMVNSWQQAPSVRAVTATTDTLQLTDFGNLVSYNNSGGVAVGLAQATGSYANYNVFVKNVGTAGNVVITPATSTINGQSSLTLAPGQSAWIVSDGTNYQLGTSAPVSLPIASFNGGTGASSSTFWRGDGTWAATPLLPEGGTTSQALLNNGTSGSVSWYDQCLNIEAFGGSGNDSTDNTTPLNNALAALSSRGGCVFFPPGKYLFNSPVSYTLPAGPASVSIYGGGSDNTILTWPAGGGISFAYSSIANSVHVRDLALTTGTVNTGSALALAYATANQNPANTAVSDVTHVAIRGDDGYSATDYWANGILIQNVSNVNFDGISINGSSGNSGIGIALTGLPASSTYGVVYNVAKSNFTDLNAGVVYGSYIQGVTVSQCNFTAGGTGIAVPASETGTLAQLTVAGSQFGGLTNAISLQSPVLAVMLTNNLVIVTASPSNGFLLQNIQHYTVTGNVISSANATDTTGVVINNTNATKGLIIANSIYGFTTGVLLQSGTSNAVAIDNVLGNTTAVVDQGTGDTTTPNY